MRGEELGGGEDGEVGLGEGVRVAADDAIGFRANGAEVLNRIFQIPEVGVDGLIEDLFVQRHWLERIAQERHHSMGGLAAVELPRNVVDVVETDGGDETPDAALFGQRPDTNAVCVERLPPGEHIEEHVRIDKHVHAHSLYLSRRESVRTSL